MIILSWNFLSFKRRVIVNKDKIIIKYSKLRFAANPWSISSEEEVFYLETTKTADGLFCAKVNFKNYVTMCTHKYV